MIMVISIYQLSIRYKHETKEADTYILIHI